MANSWVQVPADSTGKKIDAASLDVGVDSVQRQRIILADNTGTSTYATVMSSGPAGTEGGLVVRNIPSGTQTVGGTIDAISATVTVAGQVSLAAGTANIGTINNISATVVVSGALSLAAGTANIGSINNISAPVVLAAGAANIGIVNNISATVLVAGQVSLAAGTANIGTINNISAAVVLAAGAANIGSINNISAAVVLAAGTSNVGGVSLVAGTALIGAVSLAAGTSNIGTINNISAAVVLAAGSANIGTLNNISATVNVAYLVGLSARATVANAVAVQPWADRFGRPVVQLNHPSLHATASHGPKCTTLSTSATVALVAAPGSGLSIYVSMIACTNGSATLTRADVYEASATASCTCQMYMAASGGGFAIQYDPPVQVLSNSALNARVKPNVSQAIFNVHFYVGPK